MTAGCVAAVLGALERGDVPAADRGALERGDVPAADRGAAERGDTGAAGVGALARGDTRVVPTSLLPVSDERSLDGLDSFIFSLRDVMMSTKPVSLPVVVAGLPATMSIMLCGVCLPTLDISVAYLGFYMRENSC